MSGKICCGAIIMLCIVMCISPGCNSSPDEQYPYTREGLPDSLLPLYNEILSIHDEVMPEMNTLSNYQDSITAEIRTLKSNQNNIGQVRDLNQILGDLNKAEDAMMSWMHHFNRIDSVSDQEKKVFLENEKLSVREMRNLVFNSLQSAKDYLGDD